MILSANRNWERWHLCRRVVVLAQKLAGKDAGAPGIAGVSGHATEMLMS
jgi:hypothetical protein